MHLPTTTATPAAATLAKHPPKGLLVPVDPATGKGHGAGKIPVDSLQLGCCCPPGPMGQWQRAIPAPAGEAPAGAWQRVSGEPGQAGSVERMRLKTVGQDARPEIDGRLGRLIGEG